MGLFFDVAFDLDTVKLLMTLFVSARFHLELFLMLIDVISGHRPEWNDQLQ